MTAFRRIFSVSGSVAPDPPEPSRLDLRESEISGNAAAADGSQWVAVDARNNAAVTVTNTTVSDNSGAEHLFSASQSSTIALQKVDITNTFGALPIVSSLCVTSSVKNLPTYSHCLFATYAHYLFPTNRQTTWYRRWALQTLILKFHGRSLHGLMLMTLR
jgi:hypothetical protein